MPDLRYRRVQTGLFLRLMRLTRKIEVLMAQHFRTTGIEDITPAQANALMLLFEQSEPITARKLAEQLGLSEVTVSRFVRALEAEGWMERERDPSDARAILLKPTQKAYETLPKFVQVSNDMMDEAFEGMTRDEVQATASYIETILNNVLDAAAPEKQ